MDIVETYDYFTKCSLEILSVLMSKLPAGEGLVNGNALSRLMHNLQKIKPNNVASFAAETLGRSPNSLIIRNIEEIVDVGAIGISNALVSIVMDRAANKLAIIKIFPNADEFANELVALQRLGQEDLSAMNTIRVLGIARTADNSGILITSVAPGRAVDTLMVNLGRLPKGQGRIKALEYLTKAVSTTAQSLAVLHTAPIGSGNAVSSTYMQFQIRLFTRIFSKVEAAQGVPGLDTLNMQWLQERAKRVVQGFKQNPGTSAITHGDAHPGNFFYSPQTGVTLIDTPTLNKSIGAEGTPVGLAAQDFGNFEQKLVYFSRGYNLQAHEIEQLKQAFQQSYYEAGGAEMTEEAIRFFRTRIKLNLWRKNLMELES